MPEKSQGTIEYIELEIQILQQGPYFIAYNPHLNISSFGDTQEEAFEAFEEMIQLWVEETRSMGTFESLMQEAGFQHSYINNLDLAPSSKLKSPSPGAIPTHLLETRRAKMPV